MNREEAESKLQELTNAREGIVIIRGAREQIQSAVFKVTPFTDSAQDAKLVNLYTDINDLLVDVSNELAKTAIDLQINLKKELTKDV